MHNTNLDLESPAIIAFSICRPENKAQTHETRRKTAYKLYSGVGEMKPVRERWNV